MKDLATDSNGQLMIANEDLIMANGNDAVEQKIWMVLNMQKGSYASDPSAGFDKNAILGQKLNSNSIETAIAKTLKSQVKEVVDVSLTNSVFDTDKRKLMLYFDFVLKDGTRKTTQGELR